MRLMIFVLVIILLASLVFASVSNELADCNNNIRCTFSIAANNNDPNICDSLDGGLADNCREFVSGQVTGSDSIEVKTIPKTVSESKDASSPVTMIVGMLLSIITFLFITMFLFFEHYRHESFIRDNKELVAFVKKSLNKKVSEKTLRERLSRVGWKDDIIDEAIRDARHIKK